MCQKKAYTDVISQFAEDLNIRIVYSSLPDFKDRYMVHIRENYAGCSFRERIITQEEAQIINVDDISVELDITSYTCRMFHAVLVSEEELWSVLDAEAFTNVGTNTINRQLSETYHDDGFDIDLNRDLRKVTNDTGKEEYVSHIMTMVYLPVPQAWEHTHAYLERAIHAAEAETTLCFSEKLYQ